MASLGFHEHIGFQTTTAADCIPQQSVVSPLPPHSVQQAHRWMHLETHPPSSAIDYSEAGLESQHYQFANVLSCGSFVPRYIPRALNTTFETSEI